MIERAHPSSRHLAQVVIAVVLLAGLSGASLAAEDLRIEAEEFPAYGFYNKGGEDIRASYCSYASGGLAVDGLDRPDEWFKLRVTFAYDGCYSSRIDYQSAYDDTVRLVVRLLDCPVPGEELRADYVLVDGFGFG
jgi:hypothetical protein